MNSSIEYIDDLFNNLQLKLIMLMFYSLEGERNHSFSGEKISPPMGLTMKVNIVNVK